MIPAQDWSMKTIRGSAATYRFVHSSMWNWEDLQIQDWCCIIKRKKKTTYSKASHSSFQTQVELSRLLIWLYKQSFHHNLNSWWDSFEWRIQWTQVKRCARWQQNILDFLFETNLFLFFIFCTGIKLERSWKIFSLCLLRLWAFALTECGSAPVADGLECCYWEGVSSGLANKRQIQSMSKPIHASVLCSSAFAKLTLGSDKAILITGWSFSTSLLLISFFFKPVLSHCSSTFRIRCSFLWIIFYFTTLPLNIELSPSPGSSFDDN